MRTLLVLLVMFFIAGCATTSKVAARVDAGMTLTEVRKAVGSPWSKNIKYGPNGAIYEEWIYRETTWDDGGWSWDHTMFNTYVVFQNGKVVQITKDPNEIWKTRVPVTPPVVIQQNQIQVNH